jgi:CBS domain-containing protein
MTYWIYSQGIPMPARADKLLAKQRVKPLTALTKNAKISDKDENSIQSPTVNAIKQTTINTVYSNNSETERQLVKHADEIMTSPVVTLYDDTPFSEAWIQFQEYRFRHFPVTNKNKQIIGIVSDRDIFTHLEMIKKTMETEQKINSISQVMVNKVITASPDTSIHEICRVMFSQHIGALPIVDENHQLLGLITRSDILRVLIKSEAMNFWA